MSTKERRKAIIINVSKGQEKHFFVCYFFFLLVRRVFLFFGLSDLKRMKV
jgi:hypothetical protein